ncbi:hypothetical protein BE21_57420 [Sorangium cellulosum]|uniref:Uncharacterized protein n=1 Tax=Sorangium cellulosum TaxID=56 RepID=A0A150U3A9_SORCE|nr:hypothetical protein BE21_57420 [Sorangium cellulosum]
MKDVHALRRLLEALFTLAGFAPGLGATGAPALRAERAAGRDPASRSSSGRILAAPVVEVETAAELLLAVAGETGEQLGQLGPAAVEGVGELGLGATIPDGPIVAAAELHELVT